MVLTWMRRFAELAGMMLEPRRARTTRRRVQPRDRAVLDGLDTREVLSAVMPTPFASVPGHIGKAGDVAHVSMDFQTGEIRSIRLAPIMLAFPRRTCPRLAGVPQSR